MLEKKQSITFKLGLCLSLHKRSADPRPTQPFQLEAAARRASEHLPFFPWGEASVGR